MRFSVISSGSRANCTFVESGATRVLIDCGLSASQAEKRLRQIGIDPLTIDAILVTHEHRDHVHGIPVFCRRYNRVNVFTNKRTAACLDGVRGLREYKTGEAFRFQDLEILPFSINHDAAEPVGYRIQSDNSSFAQVTDIGQVTSLVRQALKGCNAMVVESNHDEDLLRACDYPWVLKQRILSTHGHLSNEGCGELLSSIMHDELINLVLGHISENSNTPAVARETVSRYLPSRLAKSLTCASIYQPTPFIEVGETAINRDLATNY